MVSVILSSLFREKETIQLSRGDLFTLAKGNDMATFIVATILWGYSSGMRGNHFQTITDELESLMGILFEAKQGVNDWNTHYKQVEAIRGLALGISRKVYA